MDFKKEYEKFLTSGADAVFDDFDKQKEELQKKSHMINVLNILKTLEEHRKNIPQEIVYLLIKSNFDYDMGHKVKVSFLNKDKKEIIYIEEKNFNDTEGDFFITRPNLRLNSEYIENNEMNELQENLHFFHEEPLINPLLKIKKTIAIKNDDMLIENLFNLFLNDELKSIIKSVQLDIGLSDKTISSKKLKI